MQFNSALSVIKQKPLRYAAQTAKSRVLFIAKKSDYNYSGGNPLMVTGLKLSAGMCVDVLNAAGIPAKLVIVNDNNDIDREVTAYKPTHVIIEALWVVPAKFAVLTRLHPTVRWIVRLHSEIPFLANDGIALTWILQYVRYGYVFVSANSPNLNAALNDILQTFGEPTYKNVYLPNCYVTSEKLPHKVPCRDGIQIGCFGAIRPFKNQLIQAIAAIAYADSIDHQLTFHMNGTRQESGGSSVLKNLIALFDNSPKHHLTLHSWLDHDDFLKLCATMDLGMQVSLSESFNIVTADMVTVGVPMVVSSAVYWMPDSTMADPYNVADIVSKLRSANVANHQSFSNLRKTAHAAADVWIDYFKGAA